MTNRRSSQARFCTQCGAALHPLWIEAEQWTRLVCSRCSAIHYQNPRVLVVAMITCGSRVLLCRRAHAPAFGLWNAPGGFMEENETLEQAAAREAFEESGVRVDPDALILHTIANLPSISEVYVTFRATVERPQLACGPESLESRFFAENEIPWHELAYPAMTGFLRMFFREMLSNQFGVHLGHVDESGKSRRSYHLLAIGEKEYSVGAAAAMMKTVW
jgi:ADP-ribose pyrophosphatase YjhB (NUDIX family)